MYRDEALRLAEDELSRLKGENFTAHGLQQILPKRPGRPGDLTVNMRGGSITFARSIQITDIASTFTALKRIDVAVGWTHGKSTTLLAPTNRNRQTSISTIIVQGD